jgi:hypothetical protein
MEEVKKGILPLQVVQSKIKENIDALEQAKAEIVAVQSLAESKNNWINFFSDLQDRLVKVEDVWLESLQVLRSGPADAAYATRELLKPKFAIPMHYGTNPLLRGTPKEYMDALGQSATKVLVLEPGAIARF